MSLAFTPLSIEQHTRRFPEALLQVFDIAFISDNEDAIRPDQRAANVFDFDDGMRLIISLEKLPNQSEPVLHVCASVRQSKWPLHRSFKNDSAVDMDKLVQERVRVLSGGLASLTLTTFTTLVIHWYGKYHGS